MATAINPYSLPPLDKYSLIGIWISTMVYGVNVILYFSCMYILLRKQNEVRGQWPLLATSTILYVLATLHIGASLRQLIECFIEAPKTGIQGAGILYWLDFKSTTEKIKGYVYTFIDTTQDLVLIWRLYVVWGNNWKLALLPFLIEMAHFGIALFETEVSLNGIPFSSKLPVVAYVLVIIVNVGTTVGIAGRLWYMGRRSGISGSTGSWSSSGKPTNRYMAPIYTIVESGAIFTLSSIVLLGMFARNDARLETAVNVATQLAALTPLLIIVRVGFGLTHGGGGGGGSGTKSKALTNPHVQFGRVTGSGIGSGGVSSGTAVSTINVYRTVETESSARTPVGSFKDTATEAYPDDYAMDDMKDARGPLPFTRSFTDRSEV